MTLKRSHTYRVTTRFKLPDGTTFDRKIAENALTPQSAANKVKAHYQKSKLGSFEIISVVRV